MIMVIIGTRSGTLDVLPWSEIRGASWPGRFYRLAREYRGRGCPLVALEWVCAYTGNDDACDNTGGFAPTWSERCWNGDNVVQIGEWGVCLDK